MSRSRLIIFIALSFITVIGLIVLTFIFIPQANPPFDVAVGFVNAAGKGDDAGALAFLSDDLQQYVVDNCPNGSPSACVDAYTPPEWGKFLSGIYRRSEHDGPNAWNILIIAAYEKSQGFSGVCIYTRTEKVGENWQVTRWSGYISCDESNAGLSSLVAADAPNHAP